MRKMVVVVMGGLNKGGGGGGGGGGLDSRVLGNLALSIGLAYLTMTGQIGVVFDGIGWVVDTLVSISLTQCPSCGQEFQTFKEHSAQVLWNVFSGGGGRLSRNGWLADCIRMLDDHPGWKLGHVRRDQNVMADAASKKARMDKWSWVNESAIPLLR